MHYIVNGKRWKNGVVSSSENNSPSVINVKLSNQGFWPRHENELFKILTMLLNQSVSFKSGINRFRFHLLRIRISLTILETHILVVETPL